ncbi:MAG: hypothetical protein KAY10_04230 [Rhodoferax sp.]|nr:hypothetical protein [Rhodoferax sp.]
MKYAYSPATGEIIVTDSPAEWMGTTAVPPPQYDPQTEGCFWVDGVWAIVPAESASGSPSNLAVDPKMTGIEYGGVMCSATMEDQNGLVAVQMAAQMQGASFQPTKFNFENGNSLVLTQQNLAAFAAVWVPFRQSFFVPE